jgi:hypothetical protein
VAVCSRTRGDGHVRHCNPVLNPNTFVAHNVEHTNFAELFRNQHTRQASNDVTVFIVKQHPSTYHDHDCHPDKFSSAHADNNHVAAFTDVPWYKHQHCVSHAEYDLHAHNVGDIVPHTNVNLDFASYVHRNGDRFRECTVNAHNKPHDALECDTHAHPTRPLADVNKESHCHPRGYGNPKPHDHAG